MLTRVLKLLVLIVSLLVVPLACDDLDEFFVDCDECYSDKPEYAVLSIKFTINDENPYVIYTLYAGSVDNGNVIAVDTSYSSKIEWDLAVNTHYSVIAEYLNKGRTIYAVDGTELRIKKDRSSCDGECYIILGDKLDARLKY